MTSYRSNCRLRAAGLVAIAACLLAGCGGPTLPPIEEGDGATGTVPAVSAVASPTTLPPAGAAGSPATEAVLDPVPLSLVEPSADGVKVAVCAQSTTDQASALRTLGAELRTLVDLQLPPEELAKDKTEAPSLELRVLAITDTTTGPRPFGLDPLIDGAVPPVTKMPPLVKDIEDADARLASLSARDENAANRADAAAHQADLGFRLADLAGAAQALGAGADSGHLDLVGCAVGARDFLVNGPAAKRVLLFMTTGDVGPDQDIAPEYGFNVGALADIDGMVMLSTCRSHEECSTREASWTWFTEFFHGGAGQPFVARDPRAAMKAVNDLIGGS